MHEERIAMDVARTVMSAQAGANGYCAAHDYGDICLPQQQTKDTLKAVMQLLQQRVQPEALPEVERTPGFHMKMHWQSSDKGLQLDGVASHLGLAFWLSDSIGYMPFQADSGGAAPHELAFWHVQRNLCRSRRGELVAFRLNKRRAELVKLSVELPLFAAVPRASDPRWWIEKLDFLDDLVSVTQKSLLIF